MTAKTRWTAAVLVVTIMGVYGCFGSASTIGARLPRTSRFSDDLQQYARLQPNKAIAVAGDFDTIYVSGYAFGYADEAAAVEAAMAACEARRIDRRVTAPCRTYAVGDLRVADAGGGPTSRR